MTVRRWRARQWFAVGLAGAGVLISGCGSAGDDGNGSPSGTGEASGTHSGASGNAGAGASSGGGSGTYGGATTTGAGAGSAGTTSSGATAGGTGAGGTGAGGTGAGGTGAGSTGVGATDASAGASDGGDASASEDAGGGLDATLGADAATAADGWAGSVDANGSHEAGVGADAGSSHDASVAHDAGADGASIASHDAGALGDATSNGEGGASHDAGTGAVADSGGAASDAGSGAGILGAASCTGPGTTWYASPSGSGSSCTMASPCSLATAAGKPAPGDIVCLRGGTYTQGPFVTVSGTAAKWISFVAYPGELPILDSTTGVNVTGSFVSFNGLVSEGASSGFANKWIGQGATTSNGNLEFVNCIADFNTKSGIAFQSAQGVHIAQCIVAHNGASTTQSWSSGVDLFGAQGAPADNVVERNVAFENVDNQNHTDGSGFIADDIRTGATFQNNIGFRNGGSCIRITTAVNTHILNNSCYHDGLDTAAVSPNAPGEILFSSAGTLTGALLQNNLAAASGWNGTQTAFVATGSLAIAPTNLGVNANGATPFFVDPAGVNPNFNLVSASAANIIGKGSTANGAPTDDIGFDPKCVTNGAAPQGPSSAPTVLDFWTYSIDYTYVASVGGVSGCFHPRARANPPSIGAYEP